MYRCGVVREAEACGLLGFLTNRTLEQLHSLYYVFKVTVCIIKKFSGLKYGVIAL